MAMTKQLVTIVNKVNNAAIRRIKNERGDLVYVVPSYTLPDNVVMNNLLYPGEEIANGYTSLEDTPAPAAHPMDAQGNYITANSPDGILYYQCGIFNKNVQRVECNEYGHRVYVEKHIHVETAMQSDRGRRIIDAIDKGEPIHTSTGVLLDKVNEKGVSPNGKAYEAKAINLMFDHDAILLDEEGAATPSDGVGLLVNSNLFTHVQREGQQLTVNTASLNANQSFNDLRETLQVNIQDKFGDNDKRVWLCDFGDDYAVFEDGQTSYMVSYNRNGESVTIDNQLEEVKRKTMWERISSGVKSVLTSPFTGLTSNKEGDDMAFKDMLKKRLGDKYEENMSDEDMMNAYDKMMKANAADETATNGEQDAPQVEVNQADIQEMVQAAVQTALQANANEAQKAEKAAIVEKLETNGIKLEESEVKALSVNSLQSMLDKSNPKAPAYGLSGSQGLQANSNEDLADTLPE